MNLKSSDLYKQILSKINTNEGVWDMIVVDGVVGVGKSTLLNILVEEGYVPFREPVVDNPILDKFYYDRKRYSFPLQVFFLNKRFQQIKEAGMLENSVLDRSIYGDAIFAKMLCDSGDMQVEEFELYKELLENMLEHIKAPKLLIYLEASVDEAVKRIKKRGRDYEQIVEIEYWKNLNNEYKEYFECYDKSPVLKINVDGLDFENNMEHRKIILDKIHTKLNEVK